MSRYSSTIRDNSFYSNQASPQLESRRQSSTRRRLDLSDMQPVRFPEAKLRQPLTYREKKKVNYTNIQEPNKRLKQLSNEVLELKKRYINE